MNKNTVNVTESILRLIGDLPSGTPVASEAAFGWSWLARLLEHYSFEAHMVYPLRAEASGPYRPGCRRPRTGILGLMSRRTPAWGWITRRCRPVSRFAAGWVR